MKAKKSTQMVLGSPEYWPTQQEPPLTVAEMVSPIKVTSDPHCDGHLICNSVWSSGLQKVTRVEADS